MSEANGTHVTRAELAAHIKGIDEHFDTVESALLRVERKIDGMVESRRGRWRAWGPPLLAAVISAGVAALVAVLVG